MPMFCRGVRIWLLTGIFCIVAACGSAQSTREKALPQVPKVIATAVVTDTFTEGPLAGLWEVNSRASLVGKKGEEFVFQPSLSQNSYALMTSHEGALPSGSSWRIEIQFRFPHRGHNEIGLGFRETRKPEKRPLWVYYKQDLKQPSLRMGGKEQLFARPESWHTLLVTNDRGHWEVMLDGQPSLSGDVPQAEYTLCFGSDSSGHPESDWTTLALKSVRIEYTEGPKPEWIAGLSKGGGVNPSDSTKHAVQPVPGNGLGNGSGAGAGNASGGGLTRGIPFGDITDVPGGNKNGGSGSVHIVYCLDISGSMREGNKIGKTKEALKKAISQLKPTDTFNLIAFSQRVHLLSPVLLPAMPEIVKEAMQLIDDLRLGDGTNISAAMEKALSIEGITHVILMSDGEPNGGIQDFDILREWIKANNVDPLTIKRKAHIITLGLGLGENFKGEPLMKGIAADSGGKYRYINLNDAANKAKGETGG